MFIIQALSWIKNLHTWLCSQLCMLGSMLTNMPRFNYTAYWYLFNIATIILRPDKYNNLNITWLFGPFQNRHLLFYLDVISIMDHLAIVHFKPFENLTCLNLPKFSLKFKTFLFLDWRICPRLVPYGNRCSGHGRLQEKYSHLETRYNETCFIKSLLQLIKSN